jgi:post-segregation antitoxin (ccd killing protein)
VPAQPGVSATTLRLYNRLPEFYRQADARQPDWPLLRFLSLVVDQLGELEVLYDRIDFVSVNDGGAPGDTSDLVNPATADTNWLRWLAQLVGVDLSGLSAVADQRAAIASASSGWQAGTKGAIAAAAQSILTGGRYTKVADHNAGDQWRVLVTTRTSETPGGTAAVLAAIAAKKVTPAGVQIDAAILEASWDTLEARYPTWAAWDTTGSWDALQDTV